MDSSNAGLSRSELAAIDMLIAGVEDGRFDVSAVKAVTEEGVNWWRVVQTIAELVCIVTQAGGGVEMVRGGNEMVIEAAKRLPEAPTLDDLIAFRNNLPGPR